MYLLVYVIHVSIVYVKIVTHNFNTIYAVCLGLVNGNVIQIHGLLVCQKG